jgi:hypothetical protein
MLKAAVSGSFHRHMSAIYTAVAELRAAGVDVLSPSDPRVVDHIGEFLFVASDRLRSIKLVQDRHFEAIRCADFLWVECPDGYTGPSTCAEIGAAHMCRTPVFSDHLPFDITIQQYVRRAPSIRAVVRFMLAHKEQPNGEGHFLLDPDAAIDASIKSLEGLRPTMKGTGGEPAERHVELVRKSLLSSFR